MHWRKRLSIFHPLDRLPISRDKQEKANSYTLAFYKISMYNITTYPKTDINGLNSLSFYRGNLDKGLFWLCVRFVPLFTKNTSRYQALVYSTLSKKYRCLLRITRGARHLFITYLFIVNTRGCQAHVYSLPCPVFPYIRVKNSSQLCQFCRFWVFGLFLHCGVV